MIPIADSLSGIKLLLQLWVFILYFGYNYSCYQSDMAITRIIIKENAAHNFYNDK